MSGRAREWQLTNVTSVTLSFTILRGHQELPMLHGFVPGRRQSPLVNHHLPISPLYAPHGIIEGLQGRCSEGTYGILRDMYELTRTFIARWQCVGNVFSPAASPQLASWDAYLQQIYSRLLYCPPADGDVAPDWIYESCRLAALIYCRSIVQGVPFSVSANVIRAHAGHTRPGITYLSALHSALDNTNKKGYWGDLYGVFMWVCLVGGAASWPSNATTLYDEEDQQQRATAWTRKCFALDSVKASLAHNFEHAGALVESQRTMLQVQNFINVKRSMMT